MCFLLPCIVRSTLYVRQRKRGAWKVSRKFAGFNENWRKNRKYCKNNNLMCVKNIGTHHLWAFNIFGGNYLSNWKRETLLEFLQIWNSRQSHKKFSQFKIEYFILSTCTVKRVTNKRKASWKQSKRKNPFFLGEKWN